MSPVFETDKSQSTQDPDKTASITPEKPRIVAKEKEILDGEEKAEYAELSRVEKELDAEIEKMKAELEAGPSMKETMERLHEYNEIKDAAQQVLGAMASMQGITIASLHREYNLPMGEE